MNSKFINIFFIFLFFLVSCKNKNSEKFTDPDVELYENIYSSGFKIEGYEDSPNSVITVYNPWQGAEGVASRLFISRDNIKPENFEGQIITGIPQKIVCMSSTNIAMLDALDEVSRVYGVSGLSYITNPYILKNKEKIVEVGYEGNMDYETLVSLKPDIVLLYGVNGASSIENKLKEFGIPYLYLGDYLEETPLGKAEWIMTVAELLDKRENGSAIFEGICERYTKLKNKVDSASVTKPRFMLNTPFADSWFMPSTESYVANMMKDAGGEYIYKKNTGNSSVPIDMEEAFLLASESDYWLNVNNLNDLNDLKNTLPKFKDISCVKEKKVFNNNLRSTPGGGNDCYESGIMNPDLMLRDLIKIFHPQLIEDEFVYYRHLE